MSKNYKRHILLPHTNLRVGRIGLGSSLGIDPDDLELAYENGINYFYWGSLRRPGFGRGIQRLARTERENIVVALQSYARGPGSLLTASVESGLWWLGLDYADILILGWHNQRPGQATLDAALELREKGRVRHLMMSSHNRPFFAEMADEEIFDLFMVRYNAAHRGAEKDVFPGLPRGKKHPAICAYTATRWGTLLDPNKIPKKERVPRASDCYRFCLTNPEVDMVLCGPSNTDQVREAIAALKAGPLDKDQLAWMRRVGDFVYKGSPIRSLTD